MAFLEVANLEAFYGPIQALHGISFSLEKGGITTILGANGAGKTTTLRSICGMVKTGGQINFDGQSIAGKKTENIVRHGVAHVPEGRGTFVRVSTEDNLKLGAYSRRDAKAVAEDMERVYGYFPRLKERRNQQAGTLSGGEQQMLALARGLMSAPRLLLLDEPSLGLAPTVAAALFEMIVRVRERGVTVFIVEQDIRSTLAIADSAYVLENGRIVLAGSGAELLESPLVKEAYLGL